MMGYMTVRPETALAAIGVAVLVSPVSAAAAVIRTTRIAPAAAFRKGF